MTLVSGEIRDDKVFSESECNEFLKHELVVEEKVDGANLGISIDSEGNILVQNRGEYLHLPGVGQWRNLEEWLKPKNDTFFENLSDRFILFGEWCYAQHSIFYNRLPDWFLGFDLYDKKYNKFLSSARRNDFLNKMSIAKVPTITRGRFTDLEIKDLLSDSKFADQPAEGLYLRLEESDWLIKRAKLLRPEFIQSVEQHWSHSSIKPNRLRLGHL